MLALNSFVPDRIHMTLTPSTKNHLRIVLLIVALGICAAGVSGQSLDPNSPTPIGSNTLIGKITARDLGDSRLTDHYYAFTGNPGDLLITIQSRNLNGDLDVFTAGTMRPLLKVSLDADNSRPVTKAIFLRRRESLVLRIEARSPNDDEGGYQLFFGGTFEGIAGGLEIGEAETAGSESTTTSVGGRKPKRVTSVGARIDEPVTEVAATPTPEPTPEVKVEEPKTKIETPRTPVRTGRIRAPTTRRTPTRPATTPKTTETAETTVEKKEESTETAEAEPKPKPPARTRRGAATARTTTPKPPPEPEPETGPRLVIETNDGTLINRSMSGVRRVTVENGQVVVTSKDGKIDRILLANVVRMSIAP